MTLISLIVAVSNNGAIGVNNQLPWRIPADLKYFKKATMGKPIIMGRKTWDSIGKPLPGRSNIVMTRDASWQRDGVERAADLEQALHMARKIAEESGAGEVMVIGGEAVYREALPMAQRIYLTRVDIDIDGDAFFPDLNDQDWSEKELEYIVSADGQPGCRFLVLERLSQK